MRNVNRKKLLDKITTYIDSICDKKVDKIGFLIVVATEKEAGIELDYRTNMESILPAYHLNALGLKVIRKTAGNLDEEFSKEKETIQ